MIAWLVNLHGIGFSLSLWNPETSRLLCHLSWSQVSEIIAKYDFPSYLREFSYRNKHPCSNSPFFHSIHRSLTRCRVHLSLSEEIDRSPAIWVGFVVQMIFTIFHLLDAWLGFLCVSKNRGVSPKMDGENNGNPYYFNGCFGGKPPIFGNTHIVLMLQYKPHNCW